MFYDTIVLDIEYIEVQFWTYVAETRHIPKKGVCLFMLQRLKQKWNNRKWTMYLFYNGVLIAKRKISDKSEIETLFVRAIGRKNIFGSNNVGLMVKPKKLLKTDEKHKKIYFGTTLEMGVDL